MQKSIDSKDLLLIYESVYGPDNREIKQRKSLKIKLMQ
jgi:hypothetical protein